MVYTKFRGGFLSDSCVYVDANDGGKWAVDSCEDSNKYFVCEKTTDTRTTIVTTTTEKTTTVITTSSLTSLFSSTITTTATTSLLNNENTLGLKLERILVPIVAGVIVLVGIVITAYVVKRRRILPESSGATEHVEGGTISSEYEDVSDVMTLPQPGRDGTYEELKGRVDYENSLITGSYASLGTRRGDFDRPHEAERE